MWNIFKSKQNTPQAERNNQEDSQQIIKQLKLKLQGKMKVLSQNIQQSQQYFNRYSQIPPKQQELITTFEEIISTLQGLVSIIEELRKQIGEIEQQQQQLKKAKNMVGNHHSIINNLQQSYNEQIRNIYINHKRQLQTLQKQNIDLKQQIIIYKQQKNNFLIQLQNIKIINIQLININNNLKKQNEKLNKQIIQYSLKYNLYENNNNKIKIINFQSIKLQYIFYYSKLKNIISQYLSIKDYYQLQKINKYFKYTLHKQQGYYIYNYLQNYYKKQQKKQLKNIKYYQKILQLFPSQNIKINAIKYLYFKIKPATYILPYLQQDIEITQNKIQQNKQKNKFNWRGLFSSQKKKDQNKFNLSQLKNQQEFKKIQIKIQNTFKSILNIKLPQDLSYFSEIMEKQFIELKNNLGNKAQKGSQIAWTAQLHCLCRFMYLQINQIYSLLQVIFGELISKSKQLINVQQAYDQLKQNQIILRNLIGNVSQSKANLQKKSAVLQNQILKRNIEKDILTNNLGQTSSDLAKLRQKYENLLIENGNFKKTLERLHEERRYFEQNLSKIRKQLQNLDNFPSKTRKMSQISMSSDGTHKD